MAGNTAGHDVIAQNQIQEISMWTQDVRHLPGKMNAVSDLLSRPGNDKIGTAYKLETISAIEPEQPQEMSVLNEVSLQLVDHSAIAEGQRSTPRGIEPGRRGILPRRLAVQQFVDRKKGAATRARPMAQPNNTNVS